MKMSGENVRRLINVIQSDNKVFHLCHSIMCSTLLCKVCSRKTFSQAILLVLNDLLALQAHLFPHVQWPLQKMLLHHISHNHFLQVLKVTMYLLRISIQVTTFVNSANSDGACNVQHHVTPCQSINSHFHMHTQPAHWNFHDQYRSHNCMLSQHKLVPLLCRTPALSSLHTVHRIKCLLQINECARI